MLQPGATPGDDGGVPGEVTEVAIVLLQLEVGRNSNGPVGKWVEFHHSCTAFLQGAQGRPAHRSALGRVSA